MPKPSDDIEIIVKAKTGKGKTTIANVINNKLRALGFKCVLIDPDNFGMTPKEMEKRAKTVAKHAPLVVVRTRQVGRKGFIPTKKKRKDQEP